MLTGILIGMAAAAGAAALCAVCYIKGRNDGQKFKDQKYGEDSREEHALMKKYEAIISFDPYGGQI